ncbi:MAG: hypothetical protein R3B93_26195 [Bacteroidia bacterium]
MEVLLTRKIKANMKHFKRAFKTYQETHNSLNKYVDALKDEDTQIRDKELQLEREYQKAGEKARSELIDFTRTEKVEYGDVLSDLFVEAIKEENWDNLYLYLQISEFFEIKNDISEKIAWCIDEILKREEIGEWSKGALVEFLMDLFHPKIMNQSIIHETAKKIIESLDGDETHDNYHAVNKSKYILGNVK